MRLIETHIKFKAFTPEEASQLYENPPAGMSVIRGGVILEAEVWGTPEQMKDPDFIKEAERKIKKQIVEITKGAMK